MGTSFSFSQLSSFPFPAEMWIFTYLFFSLKSFLQSFWKHTSTEDTLLMFYIFENFFFPCGLKAFSQDTEFHVVVFISFNIFLSRGTWVNTVSRKNGSQLFSLELTHSMWFPTPWRGLKCFLLSYVVSGGLFCFVLSAFISWSLVLIPLEFVERSDILFVF